MQIVAAMTYDGVIGKDGKLPWAHIKADSKYFRQLTLGHTVIMGRRTYESIGGPLKQRRNIVISKTLARVPGVEVVPDFDTVIDWTMKWPVFLIGGTKIYQEGLDRNIVSTMHITWIKSNLPGDTYFPKWNTDHWILKSQKDDVINDVVFSVYERKL